MLVCYLWCICVCQAEVKPASQVKGQLVYHFDIVQSELALNWQLLDNALQASVPRESFSDMR